MSFHEVQFPTMISKGSAGGPERMTDIVTLRSGFEERNSIWRHSRRKYDAAMGLRSVNDLYEVIEFFEARAGRLHAFRWMDWSDYRSGSPARTATDADQVIGVGDGSTVEFQLSKVYQSGGVSYVRNINKPVTGSVLLAVDGSALSEGTDFTVDDTTGLVTLTAAPAPGDNVTAGFHFDVPVRFDSDYISISIDAFEAGAIPTIDVLEVRV